MGFSYVLCLLSLLATEALTIPRQTSDMTKRTCIPKYNVQSYLATFDDLASTPGAPELSFIPKGYDGLYYQSFVVTQLGVAGVQPAGVIPASQTNVAANNIFQGATAGSPLITANYANSQVSTWSLKSFYYACVVNSVESAAGSATECVIQLTGQDKNGNTIAGPKNFQYTFSNALAAPMMFASVDGQFNGISTLLVDTIQSGATVALTGTFLDSVKYTTTSYPYGC